MTEETGMPNSTAQPPSATPRVQILESSVDYTYGDLFRIVRARLQYRRFDGSMSKPVTRISFERGDSVGVLLHDPDDDTVILVRQFRYPVYARLDLSARTGEGAQRAWLLEIVAGVLDEGRTVQEVAHKELLEEAGYTIQGDLRPISTFYVSPGGTSERVYLFLGQVGRRQRTGTGSGVAAEGENTQVVVLPFSEAMAMVARGEIQDAKTILALQYLALHKLGTG
jgi:nudix-type nucleoside diphosphatase (YffH/AdpP family)